VPPDATDGLFVTSIAGYAAMHYTFLSRTVFGDVVKGALQSLPIGVDAFALRVLVTSPRLLRIRDAFGALYHRSHRS
jgi:hypothetical protein